MEDLTPAPTPAPWWRTGVLYQIYPRSFADSNGDGIGDLRGVVEKLDYLEWLGVDGIWLNPIHPSPNVDWGYDVSDYTGVHPELGTLADVEALVAEGDRRGIRIILDLVPNHTSDQHPWFHERPEYYVWADEVPNNWRSVFGGGSAWELDTARGRHYLHNFARQQPDLDWWNQDVRDEFERILRFWFDRGVSGFRIDVAHALVKDRELRDEPEGSAAPVYSMNRPETHEILVEWRRLADSYDPPRVLIGEAYVLDISTWARFYGADSDELHLAFNFAFLHSDFDAARMRSVVEATHAALPPEAWPCWAGSNHDARRLATRWCDGDEALARCALLVLLTLRGTPMLYYGDELALANGHVPEDRILDIAPSGRDPGRTPMPWSETGGWHDPWLPLEDTSRNVESQRDDSESTLHFTRDLISLRRRTSALQHGRYEQLEAPEGVWAWRRGDAIAVAVNLGEAAVEIVELTGTVVLSTNRRRDGEPIPSALRLEPREGAVVTLGS